MKTEIEIGTKVTCPVTDSEGEVSYKVGILKAINSRFATVEIDDGAIKVGKTKIELFEDEKDTSKKSSKGRDYEKYQSCRASSGRKSLDNGDQIALKLRGQSLEFAYELASKHLDESTTSLKTKYSHLNPGQQRMCLGNRLRRS